MVNRIYNGNQALQLIIISYIERNMKVRIVILDSEIKFIKMVVVRLRRGNIADA